ncbi:hypothetical protein A5698_06430 [Mycobacterium sp. E136]|uniref:hypothetical protein n=1 Tax=Mycobacterium sp. E136 TaxID=1834125 RepID=UPI0007FBD8B7|nr:hypothetical protein [Mycobacterium sp. E136]OBG83610.1 hypothetical protein A5698_06430 [Mycobacterium sp. E136]
MSHPPYIEVLFARGDPPYESHVVRGLTARSLAELGCAVAEADQAGDDIADVFAAWATAYQ